MDNYIDYNPAIDQLYDDYITSHSKYEVQNQQFYR